MCYVLIEDEAGFWTTTQVRARKRHHCCVCSLDIAVGVVHDRIASLHDASWTVRRAHTDCHELTKHIQFDLCQQEVYTLDGDGLRQEVREHVLDAPESARDLLRRYRRVLRARIREGVWPVRRAA